MYYSSIRPLSIPKSYRKKSSLKPGLHISRKDRKHRLENMFSSCPAMVWSPCGSTDRKNCSLTRNICNPYVEGLKNPL